MTLEQLKAEARANFTVKYCVDRGLRIRWIRSIFFDDQDQIIKILEAIDKTVDSTHHATVEEIIKIVVDMPAFELDENGNPLIRPADLIKAIKK